MKTRLRRLLLVDDLAVESSWPPLRFAAAVGVVAGAGTAAYVFGTGITVTGLAWSLAEGVAVGVGAWSLAIGRRTRKVGVTVLGMATVAALPLVTRLTFLHAVLEGIGASADRPFGWRWVHLGGSSINGLVPWGIGLSALLALPSGLLAARWRRHPEGPRRALRPWVVAVLIGVTPLVFAIGQGFDRAVAPFLATYCCLVGLGGYAIAAGRLDRRRRLQIAGWVSVGALPVAHGVGRLTPVESWAPTALHDLAGILVTVIAATTAAVLLVVNRRSKRRAQRMPRGAAAVTLLVILGSVAASCGGASAVLTVPTTTMVIESSTTYDGAQYGGTTELPIDWRLAFWFDGA